MAAPTPQEKPILDRFRKNVSDIELDEFEQNDIFLMSWLRARELDLPKAEHMMRKSFEWREAVGYKKIHEWDPPDEYPTAFLFDIYGFDDEGCPIIFAPVGEWDIRKYAERGEKDLFLRFIQKMSVNVTSEVKAKIKTSGKFISQFVAIFDMKGFSMRQLTCYAAVDAMLESVRQYEANFPETLKAAYIINAPRIFAILFNLIKPLLSARTLSKVQIYDSNAEKWRPIILNNVPADQIPAIYGGTGTRALYASVLERSGKPGSLELSPANARFVEKSVAPGSEVKLEYIVEQVFSKIIWKFRVRDFDIGFAIRHENTGSEVVKYRKYEKSKLNALEEGSVRCEKLGKYVVLFDNTYSRIRGKLVTYLIKVENEEEEEDTLFSNNLSNVSLLPAISS